MIFVIFFVENCVAGTQSCPFYAFYVVTLQIKSIRHLPVLK